MPARLSAPLLVAAALAAAAPAAADWLVSLDGARTETRGAWEVRGPLVVFTTAAGNLASVRLSTVDIEASKAATEAAAHPQPAATPTEPVRKKPVATLTDDDVGHVEDAPQGTAPMPGTASSAAAPPADASAGTAGASPAAGAADRVQVVDWRQDLDDSRGGATLVGAVANNSSDLVQNIRVEASLVDDEGKVLASGDALVGADALQPGQKTNFRVAFPGVFHYATVKFSVKSFAFKTTSKPAGAPGT